MAEIAPFRALRYNSQHITDISQVLCPPYDIISREQQKLLLQNPFNLVHLEYGEEFPSDSPLDNKYIRAQKAMEEWLNKGLLKPEENLSLYLHQHQFQYQGNSYGRTCLLARVKLMEEASSQNGRKEILPHEGTLEEPKMDRLNLLRACQANISPIFAMYDDRDRKIEPFLAKLKKASPAIQASTAEGESHSLWVINEGLAIVQLQEYFFKKTLFIADGHHRYETSLRYRQEMLNKEKGSTASISREEEAYNFTLMGLVSMADPGLLVLPVHRLIKGISRNALAELKEKVMEHFDIYTFPLEELDPNNYLKNVSNLMELDRRELITFAILGLDKDNYHILSLKSGSDIKSAMPEGKSLAYRQLDVSLLHHLVLEGFLGLFQEMNKIAYTADGAKALKEVLSEEYQLAFLLNPVSIEKIVRVAEEGDRMPGKSTYFYPKLPTGLVINSHKY